jgi:hypothetical protein
MHRFPGAVMAVDQGDEEVFSDFDTGGEMWTGQGERQRRRAVRFSAPFKSPPVVHVALSLWDMDQGANIRADIGTERVTEQGFDLVFRTWADTRVARVRMSWLAIGEVHHDDDWQVG